MTEQEQLEQAIAVQESLRGLLPDMVVDATLAALREKLAVLAQKPRDEQRKLVTMLFADLAGWTAMSEQLDAEDVREIQQAYFAAVTPPILERGGRVEKYIGDAIFAVFGVPSAQESDPENAVHAALSMQQRINVLNAHQAALLTSPRRQRPGPQPRPPLSFDRLTSDPLTSGSLASDPLRLSLRIGVHTGPVVATLGQRDDDFLVTGDAVNLAAGLQTVAPPGGVLISHDTWRHVEDLFEVEPQALLTLKGRAELVRSYLVMRARPRPFQRSLGEIAGVKTRMVGRKAEMGLLQDALITVMEDRQAQMVTVVGEAGVGKSRLLYEFAVWADRLPQDVFYFKGRAAPETEHTPYGLLRDLFARRFQIEDSDAWLDVRQKLQEGFSSSLATRVGGETTIGAREVHLVGQLLGYDFGHSPHLRPLLDDPARLRAQALAALETYFRTLARSNPVVIVLEDVHWADNSSLDVVNHLLAKLDQTPLLMVCAGRSSLYRRQPQWGEGLTNHRRLDLQPLSKRSVGRLLQDLLQRAGEVPIKLRDLVVASADGNPYFVGELVKMMIEDGVIVVEGDERTPWRVEAERLTTIQVPPSLTSLLQARVDRLSPEERSAMQQASVVGRLFWDRAIAYIQQSTGEGSHDVSGTLSTLQAREMVFQREATTIAESREYLFKHALLRDVAYESLLKQLRRVYHGLVADWLIEQVGERIGEFVGVIADHLEGAGRREEAAGYLVRAGDQARLVHAHEEAVNRYERALILLEETGNYDRAARACMKLGLTHQIVPNYDKARQAFDRGFALWQQAEESLRNAQLPPASHAYRVVGDEPWTLDPSLGYDLESGPVIEHLFSGLVQKGPDFEIVPDVARNWHISEDGRTYVFHLRDDVRWSDGTPVTAGDFVYAWRRRLDPARSSAMAAVLFDVKNASAYHRGELVDAALLGVRAVDDRTLILELEQPAGYFLQLLTEIYPVPSHVLERCGEGWTRVEDFVTNGPFVLKAWHRGHSLTLLRNPYYHGRYGGNVIEVEDKFLSDWPTMLALYEADELDSVSILDSTAERYANGPFNFARVRQRHAGEYVTKPGWACVYMGMNAGKAPLSDPRVRKALVLAADREAFANTLYQGQVSAATGGFVPPEMSGHSPGIGLPYDPAQARRLLANAGYADGRGFPAVQALVNTYSVSRIDFLRQSWQENLGIDIAPLVLDFEGFAEALYNSQPVMYIRAWRADYPDPDNFLRVGLSLVRSWWQNETFERLIMQASQLTDQRARMQLYQQADRILVQAAAILPLVYLRYPFLQKPWLTVPLRDRSNPSKDIIIRPH